MMRWLQTGLMYLGAYAWPSVEVYAALRAASAEAATAAARRNERNAPGPLHPERMTSYADISTAELNLLLELEEQLKRENEK
jgi:hypothetical protein